MSLGSNFRSWSIGDIYFSEGPRFHSQIHTLQVQKIQYTNQNVKSIWNAWNVFSNEVAWKLQITNGLLAFSLSFSIQIPMPPVQKHQYNKPIGFAWNLCFLLMLDFLNREPYILKGTMVVDHKINITNHLNSENRSGKQFSDTFSEVYFLLIV